MTIGLDIFDLIIYTLQHIFFIYPSKAPEYGFLSRYMSL